MGSTTLKSKRLRIIIVLIIIICLVVPISLFYTYPFDKNKPNDKEQVREYDSRISPLTPQGIFIEIHRIRKKGIIDVMMNSGFNVFDPSPTTGSEIQQILEGLRPGFGWNEKPVFNYDIIINDFSWENPIDFETWDTDYINQIIKNGVTEEQPTVDIELTFYEKEKKFFRTQRVNQESFTLTYDFRNGTWTGDDSFNDSDGYGHIDSDHFEIWFSVYQTDVDGDTIPYWTEVNVLHTDPWVDDSFTDFDDDSIPTRWEWKWGYDPFEWNNHSVLDPDMDGLENIEEYVMQKWLANPFHPDMYIEVDEMEKAPFQPFELARSTGKIIPIERLRLQRTRLDGWDHVFWEESQQMLMERFNEHGITVHIDDGIMGGGGDVLPFSHGNGAHMFTSGVVSGFYRNNFSDDREGIFRYLCVIHGGGWCAPQDEKNWPDTMTVPSNQRFFMYHLNMAMTPRTKRIGRAIQVIHELGHCLGLYGFDIPGIDNTSKRYDDPPDYPWHDYVSVMNYDYFRQRYFDYSDGSNGENDHDDWSTIDLTNFQKPIDRIFGIEWTRS